MKSCAIIGYIAISLRMLQSSQYANEIASNLVWHCCEQDKMASFGLLRKPANVFTRLKRNSRFGRASLQWITAAVLGGAGVLCVSTLQNTPKQESERQSSQQLDSYSSSSQLPVVSSPSTISNSEGIGIKDTIGMGPSSSSPNKQRALPPSKKVDFAAKPPGASTSSAVSSANEPAGGSAPPPPPVVSELATKALPSAVPPSAVSSPAPSSAATSTSLTHTDADGKHWVRVYFATDRTRLDLNGSWIRVRLWLPVLFGVLLASLLGIGIVAGVQRVVAIPGVIAAMVLTVYFTQHAYLGTKYLSLLSKSTPIAFGSSRLSESKTDYPLHLGVSQVTLPPKHVPGTLERPTVLKLEWDEDENKHVVLQSLSTLDPVIFFKDIEAKQRDSALVFIHGYNVSFDDALRRTAQLTADLKYDGVPILYSWPSRANTLSYTRDEANVGWTVPHLEQFLVDLRQKGNLKQIHVIAHSMGNRALLGAIERIGLRNNSSGPLLSRIVMAAPDVDALEFKNRYASLVQRVAGATVVYGSRNDRALMLSEHIHGYDRLGLVSGEFASRENVDMIDTSPLDLSMLGHSYYGESPAVINDIKAFFREQPRASSRPWLQIDPAQQPQRIVWRFQQDPSTATPSINR